MITFLPKSENHELSERLSLLGHYDNKFGTFHSRLKTRTVIPTLGKPYTGQKQLHHVIKRIH